MRPSQTRTRYYLNKGFIIVSLIKIFVIALAVILSILFFGRFLF